MTDINGLCEMLGISKATALNWVRLGKISTVSPDSMTFDEQEIKKIIESTDMLKSRRNKSRISGCGLYADYIENSENVKVVEKILAVYNGEHTGNIIANAALQLFTKRKGNLLNDFINGKLSAGEADRLINRLIDRRKSANGTVFDYTLKFVPYEDTLGFLYISLKNSGSRKRDGIYYTSGKISSELCAAVMSKTDFKGKRILDPCCGTGNFLLTALKNGAESENIYGFDIDKTAVNILKINLILNGAQCKNIFVRDTLSCREKSRYDIIVGNPPWGVKYTASQNKALSEHFLSAKKNGTESADIFIEKSLSMLKDGGQLCLVVPQAVFNVSGHDRIRNILSSTSFSYVSYSGKFDRVFCPSVSFVTKKDGKGDCTDCRVVREDEEYTISNRSFKNRLDFDVTDSEREILTLMESGDRVYLKDRAAFALGIVTGDNDKHIRTSPDGCEPVYKGSDVLKYRLKSPSAFIDFHPDEYQQTAREEIYRSTEKLFYRFIADSPITAYDGKGSLSLNSCNILIPFVDGLSVKYVMAVLNSRAVSFYFKKKFASLKVLKGQLEAIPIPIADKATQLLLQQKTDLLSSQYDEGLIMGIDEIIDELYGIK